MAKTAIEFLSELAQRELVPPSIVASLRRQVGDSIKPISAAAIARLLVEKGHLTAVQAEKLLGAPLAAAKQPPPSPAETKPMESDLGLAPLQEIPAPTGTTAAPRKKPAEATTALEPLDLGLLDLVPLDEAPPKPAAPKPAAPVKKVPPAKPPTAAPLTPLSPLDALEPLDSPLTPIPLPTKHPPAKKAAAPATAQVRPPDPLDVAIPLAPPAKPAPAATPHKSSRAVGWIGGIAVGVVALVVVSGGLALLFFVPRQEQPDSFELAERDYRAGQYAAAAEKYDAFLTADPRHEQAALARVRRGMARMLAAKGSGDNWPAVLPVASEVLAEIDGEEELPEVHAELTSLLTEMAAALAKRADDAAGEDAAARLEEARRALALADNGRYIPGPLRDWQRLSLAADSVAVLERRENARKAMRQFIRSAGMKLDAGDMAAFLTEQEKLVAQYPELARDPELGATVSSGVKAALSAVQPLTELPEPQTSESDSPARSIAAAGSASVFVARAGGKVWALEAATGKILWRRDVGSIIDPIRLSADGDVLLAAGNADEVLCVDRPAGALRWRVPLSAPLAGPPLLAAGRIFVTTTAGHVVSLDPQSGDVAAGCQLPLAAGASAAADSTGKLLYQPAARDFLFVVSAGDLKGQSAIFLGHAPHSVHVPPIFLPGRLIVAECRGLDRTVLHVLALDEAGSPTGKQDRLEMAGQVLTPPALFGDRLIVLTDSGIISQFQFPAGDDAPLKKLGEMPAASSIPHLTFGLIAGNRLCTAGVGIAMFDLTAGEELKSRWSRWADGAFSSPPEQIGEAILCVRHSPGRGHVAAAVKVADGQPLWETRLVIQDQEAAP